MPFVLGSYKVSEFDTQAMLWSALKKDGFNVRGEVRGTLQGEKTGKSTGNKVRLDLVIFSDNGKPLIAIEVKQKRGPSWRTAFVQSNQFKAYTLLGIPVVMVCGHLQAELFLERIDWALTLPAGVHWLE